MLRFAYAKVDVFWCQSSVFRELGDSWQLEFRETTDVKLMSVSSCQGDSQTSKQTSSNCSMFRDYHGE
jgi:hypothetical protein